MCICFCRISKANNPFATGAFHSGILAPHNGVLATKQSVMESRFIYNAMHCRLFVYRTFRKRVIEGSQGFLEVFVLVLLCFLHHVLPRFPAGPSYRESESISLNRPGLQEIPASPYICGNNRQRSHQHLLYSMWHVKASYVLQTFCRVRKGDGILFRQTLRLSIVPRPKVCHRFSLRIGVRYRHKALRPERGFSKRASTRAACCGFSNRRHQFWLVLAQRIFALRCCSGFLRSTGRVRTRAVRRIPARSKLRRIEN